MGLIDREFSNIHKPTGRILEQLKVKKQEYDKRVTEKENGWEWVIDAAYKSLIIREIDKLPEKGTISLDTLESMAWDDLVNGPYECCSSNAYRNVS